MPIYEYKCENCGNVFEEWYKKISDAKDTAPCPKCHGDGHQIMSNTTFALKGGGWYVTEYGNKKQPPVTESKSNQGNTTTESTPAPSSPAATAATPQDTTPPAKTA